MRILIIATNREKSPYAVAPLGAAQLVSVLTAQGFEARLLDLAFAGNPGRLIGKRIDRFKPQLVGLSIRNLDDCQYATGRVYYGETREIVNRVRQRTAAPVIIGGGAVSVLPEELADHLGVRYAAVGEGEKVLPAFARALADKVGFDGIPGLLVRGRNGWIRQAPDFSLELDSLPLYDYSSIDYARYFRRGGFIGLQTKRGCAFRCIYCNYPTLEGVRVRCRSPLLCVDDMEKIVKDTGLRDFFFTDSVFNWPRSHALAVCEEIIRRRIRIRWLAYCNPAGLDAEMAAVFQRAGCAGIELGLDAVTDEMLINMGKGFSRADIARAYQALHKAGLPFAVFLLFGGPGDSFRNMQETQRLLTDFGKANAVFASLGIRIYRDAPIHQKALEEGRLGARDPLLQPVYYLSSSLESDIVSKLDRLARREATWSTPSDWNSLLVNLVQRILGRLRVIPNWKDIEAYGAHMRRQW
ncbi:MAG: B12-binding domain-containing radical SAM protein [Thermodesulfobacteriota bacterium]